MTDAILDFFDVKHSPPKFFAFRKTLCKVNVIMLVKISINTFVHVGDLFLHPLTVC